MKQAPLCFIILLIIISLVSCGTKKYAALSGAIERSINRDIFSNHWTGILIFDPQSGDTLYNLNSQKYFTPASNTKIFTLYAAIELLPEKLPVLKYTLESDTLFFEGTGDPTQLHPYFLDSTAIRFLKGFSNIAFYPHNYMEEKFGPGWAWEDYESRYSPERNGFPLYGNVVTVFNLPEFKVVPSLLTDSIVRVTYLKSRKPDRNRFFFDKARRDTLEIPFMTDSTLVRSLLEESLSKHVQVVRSMPAGEKKVLYGMAADSVYKRMMQQSDNFLAEQLLIQASSILSDTLSGQTARDYILQHQLSDLRQPPRWVDGSGLSRYNLFTPESLVAVLSKLYGKLPHKRLFSLMANGGLPGTLEAWYPGNPDPYLFAKTGTLGNNHCVSGYLVTRSGKTLIFSFMNNHFTLPSAGIKQQMQLIFEWIRDHY